MMGGTTLKALKIDGACWGATGTGPARTIGAGLGVACGMHAAKHSFPFRKVFTWFVIGCNLTNSFCEVFLQQFR